MSSKTVLKYIIDLGANKLKIEDDPAVGGFLMLSVKIGAASYADVILARADAAEVSEKLQAFTRARQTDRA